MYRHSRKRRKCSRCGKTWGVWKKKRGRKTKRIHKELAAHFVAREVVPMRVERKNQTRNQRQHALEKSRGWYARNAPWPDVPDGPLIVVADGLVKYLGKRWHTWYFMLVRSAQSNDAVILPPHHQEGTEVVSGWRSAFEQIPEGVRARIVGLVCDGHVGLIDYAVKKTWLIQRCHFHHLKRLQAQRSRWRKGRHRKEAERIYRCVKVVLTEPDEELVHTQLTLLKTLQDETRSNEVRKVLRGFIRNYRDYRAYMYHPELNLPTTNNTAETLVGLVERLAQHGRGFRNPDTFHEWICVLCKTKKRIACRGKCTQN